MTKLISFLTIFCFLSGCATNYVGPGPRLGLTGEQAEREVKNFSIDTHYFHHSEAVVEMGLDHRPYYVESLRPLISEVSPDADQTLRRHVDVLQVPQLVLLCIAIGALFIPHRGTSDTVFWSAWGLGVSASIYGNSYVSRASDEFNRDLRKKVSPVSSVNYVYQF